MANTYEAIATVTVGGGGAATIDFTSIPATYTDLVVKISARQGAENAFDLTFNGNASSYVTLKIQGSGSSVTSGGGGTTAAIRLIGIDPSGATANTFGNAEIYIPNYASSNYKSISYDGVNEDSASEAYMNLAAGLWSNTAAITSITITPRVANIVEHSTATLYGIKNS